MPIPPARVACQNAAWRQSDNPHSAGRQSTGCGPIRGSELRPGSKLRHTILPSPNLPGAAVSTAVLSGAERSYTADELFGQRSDAGALRHGSTVRQPNGRAACRRRQVVRTTGPTRTSAIGLRRASAKARNWMASARSNGRADVRGTINGLWCGCGIDPTPSGSTVRRQRAAGTIGRVKFAGHGFRESFVPTLDESADRPTAGCAAVRTASGGRIHVRLARRLCGSKQSRRVTAGS